MCPGASQRFRSSSVIGVGVSAAGTDMHRWNSSKPGAEKTNVTLNFRRDVLQANPSVCGNENESASVQVALLIAKQYMRRAGMNQQNFVLGRTLVCRNGRAGRNVFRMDAPGEMSSVPTTKC